MKISIFFFRLIDGTYHLLSIWFFRLTNLIFLFKDRWLIITSISDFPLDRLEEIKIRTRRRIRPNVTTVRLNCWNEHSALIPRGNKLSGYTNETLFYYYKTRLQNVIDRFAMSCRLYFSPDSRECGGAAENFVNDQTPIK